MYRAGAAHYRKIPGDTMAAWNTAGLGSITQPQFVHGLGGKGNAKAAVNGMKRAWAGDSAERLNMNRMRRDMAKYNRDAAYFMAGGTNNKGQRNIYRTIAENAIKGGTAMTREELAGLPSWGGAKATFKVPGEKSQARVNAGMANSKRFKSMNKVKEELKKGGMASQPYIKALKHHLRRYPKKQPKAPKAPVSRAWSEERFAKEKARQDLRKANKQAARDAA